LFFGIRDLFFAFGYLTAKLFVLAQQPLIFTMQLFSAGLLGVPMTIRCYTLLPRAASALALIHHTVNDPAGFVQKNRLRRLNCYEIAIQAKAPVPQKR